MPKNVQTTAKSDTTEQATELNWTQLKLLSFIFEISILPHLGSIIKHHRPSGLWHHNYIAHSSGIEKFKIWLPAELVCSASLFFPVYRLLASHCPFTWGKRQGSSVVSFIRVLISFTRVPSSWPTHFQKALPLNTITLGIRIPIY